MKNNQLSRLTYSDNSNEKNAMKINCKFNTYWD